MAAINLSEPDFSPETLLSLNVDTESDSGENQGQTFVDENGFPILVSLDPSFDNVPFDAGSVFAFLEESKPIPEPATAASLLISGALGTVLTRQKK
ncbi:MAG: PEP-CTERM sorting domain-containing protein [Cyanobacteriota bacterium]|nr:PEP-CTERM sorting domain-containing protein [Cyanobacteriota bacterium]